MSSFSSQPAGGGTSNKGLPPVAASAAGPPLLPPPASPRAAGGSPRARPPMLLQGAAAPAPAQKGSSASMDRLPLPPASASASASTRAGGIGASAHSCFSDSESDASSSGSKGLDDSSSDASTGLKSGTTTGGGNKAVVRVVKRSPSSFQRLESFLSSQGRSLSRGFSRQPSSSVGGKQASTTMAATTNPLTTSTGGLLLPPPSPSSPRHASTAAAAMATAAAPPSPRASKPLPLPPPSPGRSQPQPPSLAATNSSSNNNGSSLSGLAASVGGLLLGRSLGNASGDDASSASAVAYSEGLTKQASVSLFTLANSSNEPLALPPSPRQQPPQPPPSQVGLGAVGEEEGVGSGKKSSSSSSNGSGSGLGGDGGLSIAASMLGLDAGFAFPTPKTPTREERRALQLLARRLVIKPSAAAEGGTEAGEGVGMFDLMGEPRRALLLDGLLDKIGTEARIKRTNRRRLLLFTDVLLVAEPPLEPGNDRERVFVKQVIDLRRATIVDRSPLGDPVTFEVQGSVRGWRFVGDGKEQHALWLQQLRQAVLSLAQDTPASEKLGWQHRLYRGTLFSAALEGDVPQLEALIAYHRRVAKESPPPPQQQATTRTDNDEEEEEEEEEEEAVAELLAATDEWGLRPVHYAAAEGQEAALLFLLEKGGEASPPSDTLDTPLHYAAAQGQDQAVVRLLQKGADPHARNFQDRTPLFEATAACDALGERAERVVALLYQSAGADVAAVDASGNTPLHKACAAAAAAAAAIDAEDQDARLRNALGMVRLLTRLGANPNALRTTDGLSPLQLACGAESDAPASEGVLLLLLQAGAAPNGNARGPRPLELLLTPRFFDSGDPSDAASAASTNAATAVASSVASAASSLLSPVLGGGGNKQTDGGGDALEDAVAKEVLALRLSQILALLRHGGRLATKKLAKQGVDPSVVAQMAQAQTEWEAKALATPTTPKPPVDTTAATTGAAGSNKGAGPAGGMGGVTSPTNLSMGGGIASPTEAGDVGGAGDTNTTSSSSSKACPLCAAPFTLLFRRHHCRCCGGLACALCSGKKLAVVKPAAPKAPTTTTASTTAPATATPLSFERACDACFNSAWHQASQIRKEEEAAATASTTTTIPTEAAAVANKKEQQEREHARNQAELGILNPSGRTSADPMGARRAGAGAPGGRAGNVPASGMSARSLGAVAQTQNVMAENMQLMAERGEKLNRLAERTRGMQQNALDFKEAAKALAEREKNRKWWEL